MTTNFGVRYIFTDGGPSKTVGAASCSQLSDLIQQAYADGETQFSNRFAVTD